VTHALPTPARVVSARQALPLAAGLLAAITLLLGAAAWMLYSRKARDDAESATRYVASVAELKVRQIEKWRVERLHDVEYLTVDPAFTSQIAALQRDPDGAVADALRRRVRVLFRSSEYFGAALIAANGEALMMPGDWVPPSACRGILTRAAAEGRPVFGELERLHEADRPHVDVAAPLRGPDRALRGFLLAQINPDMFLYPLLREWPAPTRTAETLLVRRDGDSVLFLNEARNARAGALQLRLPLARADLPATAAARRERAEMQGTDYNGRPVLAATRPIQGSAWAIVSKIDASEALASSRVQAWYLAGGVLALVALTAVSIGLVMMSQQSGFYRRQLAASAEREELLGQHAKELERAEATRRETEERLRLVVAGTTTTLFIQDLDLRYTWIYNTRIFREEQVVGRTDEDLFGSSARDLIAMKRQVLATGAPTRREVALDFGAHRGFFDVVVEPYYQDGRLAGVRGVTNDLTERHLLEEQLRQAQKLEAVGQLAGGVAHDFNNLLTAILGYTELVIGQLPEGDRRRMQLEQSHQAASRAAALTAQLLAFSRKQMLQPSPVDLNVLVAHLSVMLRRIIGEDIRLELGLGESATVLADAGQLEQVLLNLCVNARDAMPLGGEIRIETSRIQLDGRPFVRVVVADTGTGIPAGVLPHIFEPFFTTKEHGKGTGLGLSTVYGVVQQSGGTIQVQSREGAGTTFILEFPEHAGPVAAVPVPSPGQEAGTERILIVEDDGPVRLLAQEILARAGFSVTATGSAEEACALAARERFDLLVTDVVMPGMDGFRLAAQFVQTSPGTRVLFMSGYASDALATRGMKGTPPLLLKPFSAVALTSAVREVLDAPQPSA